MAPQVGLEPSRNERGRRELRDALETTCGAIFRAAENGSSGWTRTNNPPVNSGITVESYVFVLSEFLS